MSAAPLMLEAANLRCSVSGDNLHLRLIDIKLPSLEEQYVDHRPGGAPVAVEIDVMLQRLQCDFTLAGWTPQVDALISAWMRGMNQFWFFGALRDRVMGEVVQAQAYMYGRLGKATPNNWNRGALHHWGYQIRGIVQYQLLVAGETVVDWDFYNNTFETAQLGSFQ